MAFKVNIYQYFGLKRSKFVLILVFNLKMDQNLVLRLKFWFKSQNFDLNLKILVY